MSDALFLVDDLSATGIGDRLRLDGEEGRHAAVVRRIRIGERILVADGQGRGVGGSVSEVDRTGVALIVDELVQTPERPLRFVVVQAVPKGDRGELAVEMLTEMGVDEVIPWQAGRSIVRWHGERGDKALGRWQSSAREAAKQSRRLRVPRVAEPVTTLALAVQLGKADLALVLHEEAVTPLADIPLPASGTVMIVVGPEGGIAPDELGSFERAGGRPVLLSDGVLRTSTAGVVALAGLLLR